MLIVMHWLCFQLIVFFELKFLFMSNLIFLRYFNVFLDALDFQVSRENQCEIMTSSHEERPGVTNESCRYAINYSIHNSVNYLTFTNSQLTDHSITILSSLNVD